MLTRIIAAALGIAILALLGLFAWGGLRGPATPVVGESDGQPAAILSEQLSDGLIEAQIYLDGDLTYRIDIQFTPDAMSTLPTSLRPDVILAMANMDRDGFDPPLELIGAGEWRTRGKVPMAGQWMMNAGYGDEFAEVTFTIE